MGDALGAEYEGGAVGRVVWKIVTAGSSELRWTDDTEMAMALAESLLENQGLNADHLAKLWAKRMRFMRGYGPGARKLLNMIAKGADWHEARFQVFPDGSFGNGAAMRAGPLGLFFHGHERDLDQSTIIASSITHAHPLGVEGGRLVAKAVDLALGADFKPPVFIADLKKFCRQAEYRSRLEQAAALLEAGPSNLEIVSKLGNSVKAHESAVTAVYAFCRYHEDFSAMMSLIINLGGDTDSIGAMAGGMFGAKNGTKLLPQEAVENIEARAELEDLGHRLFKQRRRQKSSL